MGQKIAVVAAVFVGAAFIHISADLGEPSKFVGITFGMCILYSTGIIAGRISQQREESQ